MKLRQRNLKWLNDGMIDNLKKIQSLENGENNQNNTHCDELKEYPPGRISMASLCVFLVKMVIDHLLVPEELGKQPPLASFFFLARKRLHKQHFLFKMVLGTLNHQRQLVELAFSQNIGSLMFLQPKFIEEEVLWHDLGFENLLIDLGELRKLLDQIGAHFLGVFGVSGWFLDSHRSIF